MMAYGAALLLGLIGGGHCLLMCGPLLLALPLQRASLLASCVYHLGRITTYTLMGGVAGGIGLGVHWLGVQKYFTLGLGLLLFLFLIPSVKKGFSLLLYQGLQGLKKYWNFSPTQISHFFFLGILHGFLPCGLVYVALLTALTLPHFWQSLLFMFFFGLGTTPFLLFLEQARQWLYPLLTKWKFLSPFFLALLGLLLILRGLELGIPYLSPRFYSCCH